MPNPIYNPYSGIPQFKTFGQPQGDIPDRYAPEVRIFTDDQDAWAFYMLQQFPGSTVWRDWTGGAHIAVPLADGTYETHSFNAEGRSWNDTRTAINNWLRLQAIPAAANEAGDMLPIPGLGDAAALGAAAWIQERQNQIADEVGDWHIPETQGQAPAYVDSPALSAFTREAWMEGAATGGNYVDTHFNDTFIDLINSIDRGNIWDLMRVADNLSSWQQSAITKGGPGEAAYWQLMRDQWQQTLMQVDPSELVDPYGQYSPEQIHELYFSLIGGEPYRQPEWTDMSPKF